MRDFNGVTIKLDSLYGDVVCEKIGNVYALHRIDGAPWSKEDAKYFVNLSPDAVAFFYRTEQHRDLIRQAHASALVAHGKAVAAQVASHEAVEASQRSLESLQFLIQESERVEQPLVIEYGGDSTAAYLLDYAPSLIIDLELYGRERLYELLAPIGKTHLIDSFAFKNHNRTKRGRRDYSCQPLLYAPYVPGGAQPYPVLYAGTVGAGRRFRNAVGLLLSSGLVRCGYQKHFVDVIATGYIPPRFEGEALEGLYADGYRNYGTPEPIFV